MRLGCAVTAALALLACGESAADLTCLGCDGQRVSAERVDGDWQCPEFHCPAQPADESTDESVDTACTQFCAAWANACPGAVASEAECRNECSQGYEAAPPDCTSAVTAYLSCAGQPDACDDRSATPLRCRIKESTLVSCVYGSAPDGCDWAEISGGYDTCTRNALCGDHTRDMLCTSTQDGHGNSDCVCRLDGTVTAGWIVGGLGVVACAQAAAVCDLF